jgi:hypothetical protein
MKHMKLKDLSDTDCLFVTSLDKSADMIIPTTTTLDADRKMQLSATWFEIDGE